MSDIGIVERRSACEQGKATVQIEITRREFAIERQLQAVVSGERCFVRRIESID